MSQPESSSMATKTRYLFNIVMKGRWYDVVEKYKNDPDARKDKITRSGYTALHMAVSNGREDIVQQLVNVLEEGQRAKEAPKEGQRAEKPLEMKNEEGNTPLHIAASIGNVRMCKLIARVDPILIGIKNKDGETPLFLAALHGKKEAFLKLNSFLPHETEIPYRRGKNGDTILHCAIFGEYFELAFKIIHLYGDILVDSVNLEGLTPLHVLASKPSAFQSGSKLGSFQKIVYEILSVDKLKEDKTYKEEEPPKNELNSSCPQNYQTLVNFFRFVGQIFKGNASSITSARKEIPTIENPPTSTKKEREQKEDRSAHETEGKDFLPPNYVTCFDFGKVFYKAMLIVSGPGYSGVTNLLDEKRKHTWSLQVLDELLHNMHEYEKAGQAPSSEHIDRDIMHMPVSSEDDEKTEVLSQITTTKKDSPILIAAKHGITEIVEKILEKFPVAILDTLADKKNIVLIAVENRQSEVYKLLLKIYNQNESVFREVDENGDGALHFAAKLTTEHPRWPVPGDALQMQWEIKWLKFVEESMPRHFFVRYNKNSQTPDEIFTQTHQNVVASGGKWLTKTSQSSSVVAGLFVTIAFTTSTAMPGGAKQDTGTPYLEREPAFDVFAVSSMVTFYSSVIAVVMFLAILTSGFQMKDFEKSLPRKLLLGVTALYVSIASTLISFCTGHYFILRGQLKEAAAPVYSVICLLVTFIAIAEFPLYFQLAWATFKKVPQR